EPATVELHHRAQVRRDDRNAVEHHALRAVAGVQERGDDLEPLERTGLLLALAATDDLPQPLGLGVEVEVHRALLDRRGAHAALEIAAETVAHLAVEHLVALEVLDLEAAEAVPDLVDPVQLALRPVADLLDLPLGRLAHLAALVALRAGGL